jgi:hypothetical protein
MFTEAALKVKDSFALASPTKSLFIIVALFDALYKAFLPFPLLSQHEHKNGYHTNTRYLRRSVVDKPSARDARNSSE